MKHSSNEQDKVLLSVISVCCGVLTFVLYLSSNVGYEITWLRFMVGALLGLGASISYALLGGVVMSLYLKLRAWAYKGEMEPLSSREKLRLAAFWPITLLTSLVVYLFLGIINRVF